MFTSTAIATTSRFADLFDRPVPRDLREHAETMCHDTFIDHYGHQGGPVRLGSWGTTGDDDRRTIDAAVFGDDGGDAAIAGFDIAHGAVRNEHGACRGSRAADRRGRPLRFGPCVARGIERGMPRPGCARRHGAESVPDDHFTLLIRGDVDTP